ncbi:MAG: alpha/beta hydrolase [Bacteroidota bacterium]
MEQIIESFDYKIYTKVEGEGLPVLLLHSLWGDSTLFNRLAKQLSLKFKIIRIDFPGHGNSTSPKINFTFKEFAIVLNDILEKLGIAGKIAFIGHSMGGFAALAFAKEFDEKTAAIVLMHTYLNSSDHKSTTLRERQAKLINQNRKELLLQVTNRSNFAPRNADKFQTEFDQLTYTANRVTQKGALAGIHAINTREYSLHFIKISKIPTLIVIGKQDQVYNPEDQLSEYSNLAHAELLTLINSGHLGFIEEEDIFVPRVSDFLSSVQVLVDGGQ